MRTNNYSGSGIINPEVFERLRNTQSSTAVKDSEAAESRYVSEKQSKKLKDFILNQNYAQLNRYKAEHTVRIILAFVLTASTIVWMAVIIYIIVLCGRAALALSDTVLVTLITTTTANVGIFLYHIIQYMFNHNHSS